MLVASLLPTHHFLYPHLLPLPITWTYSLHHPIPTHHSLYPHPWPSQIPEYSCGITPYLHTVSYTLTHYHYPLPGHTCSLYPHLWPPQYLAILVASPLNHTPFPIPPPLLPANTWTYSLHHPLPTHHSFIPPPNTWTDTCCIIPYPHTIPLYPHPLPPPNTWTWTYSLPHSLPTDTHWTKVHPLLIHCISSHIH